MWYVYLSCIIGGLCAALFIANELTRETIAVLIDEEGYLGTLYGVAVVWCVGVSVGLCMAMAWPLIVLACCTIFKAETHTREIL